jgi:hypothetical protein
LLQTFSDRLYSTIWKEQDQRCCFDIIVPVCQKIVELVNKKDVSVRHLAAATRVLGNCISDNSCLVVSNPDLHHSVKNVWIAILSGTEYAFDGEAAINQYRYIVEVIKWFQGYYLFALARSA